ncbi:MAG: hypothetical protein JO130_16675 [Solirubrobacterales bacterium]|nr:hypothetical protein [Solirubrobacterales bacterium]
MKTSVRSLLRTSDALRDRRPPLLSATALDGLIALVLLLEIELEAWLDTGVPHRLIAAIGAAFLVAPVVVRRRWPAAALLAGFLVAAVLSSPPADNALKNMTGPVFASLVLAYTAGARLKPRRGLSALAGGVTLLIAASVWAELAHEQTGTKLAQQLVSSIVLPGALWWLGCLWRERSRRAAAFAELLERMQREGEQHKQDAVAHERIRIGRELQDIIAQNVSAIVIQAAGARRLIGSEPDRAREAILAVERAGSEALADLRRTLGLLRGEDDPRKLAPQPGLAQLDALLESVRQRGPDCTLRTDGDPARLSTGVDLLSYRIVEAALGLHEVDRDAPALVRIGYRRTRLQIEVSGGGRAPAPHGELRGIFDRVALYHGTLDVSVPAPDTFAIHAELPLAVAER